MLDIDGTIYQTLDLKESAWHATTSNRRSVGVEIANIGAYSPTNAGPLDKWYVHTDGRTTIKIPSSLGDGGERTKGFVGHPRRPDLIPGNIQHHNLVQYDLTPQQYAALIKLTATLCTVLPKIQCRYPTDKDGHLITHKLPDDELFKYEGVMGHYHIQTDKVDPGPAFDWDYVIGNARKLMGNPPMAKEDAKPGVLMP
jgi:N-acetyl-anhydromuramyl-L-alanine amidase AmpD